MLKLGDIAPDFTLPTADGQPVSLSDTLRGGHNVAAGLSASPGLTALP